MAETLTPQSAGVGHNQGGDAHSAIPFVRRLVKLEEEKRALALDIREVLDEAKAAGLTKGALRIIVKEQLETEDQRASREAIEAEAEAIRSAIGGLVDMPLGQAAVRAAETRRPAEPKKRGRPRKKAAEPEPGNGHADLELPEARALGVEAGKTAAGYDLNANPCEQGTPQWGAWREGFMSGWNEAHPAGIVAAARDQMADGLKDQMAEPFE